MDITGKTALVIGAGSGIGRATAVALAGKGVQLVLSGRRREPLDETVRLANAEGGDAIALAGDISDADWRDIAIDSICERFGGPDILINSAGVVCAGGLEDIAVEDIRHQVEINLVAPILLIRDVLPMLRQSPEAVVVDIASSQALVGKPFYSVYAATKAGLARFDEALRRELSDSGIHVMTVYPVATDTPMMANVGGGRETPEAVAAALVDGLEAEQTDVIRGGEAFARLLRTNQQDPGDADQMIEADKQRLHQRARAHRRM